MTLSDSQIERYSRQIIVPQVGGRGQERLLASRLLIAGEPMDIEATLAYMVGAGVGTIQVLIPGEVERPRIDLMIADLHALNPDAKVALARDCSDPADLVLILAGGADCLDLARKLAGAPALIIARLDVPGKIAVMTKTPPCPECADADLLAPFAARAETAGFIAMVAAVEALKLLIGRVPSAPALLEFDGYQCNAREIKAKAAAQRCRCSIVEANSR